MPQNTRSILTLAISACLLASAVGCADQLVFAKEANRQGMELYQDGDYVDASAAFSNATKQDVRDYKSYFYLGASYQAMNKPQYQQAISAYKSCLATMDMTLVGQNDKSIRYRAMDALAQCIARSGGADIETAEIQKRSAGKANVDDQWMLAKIYHYTGDADAAIEAYNKAVMIDPSRFDIAKEAGLYEFALKQNEFAAATLKKAYAVNQDDEQVNATLRQLGVVLGPSLRDAANLSRM